MHQLEKKQPWADYAVLLAFVVYVVVILTVSGGLSSNFQIIDAHDEIMMHHRIEEGGFVHALKKEMEIRLSHRFLPVYSFIRVSKVYFFGENWSAYYIYNLVLGIICCCSFYIFARLLKYGIPAAVAFAFFTYFGAESWFNQATIIFRIASAELPGMALLGVGLIAMVYSSKHSKVWNRWEFVFLVSITIATLVKESFILLIPALLFWKVWLYSKEHQMPVLASIKKHILQGVILFTIVIIEIGIVAIFIGSDKMGYVGISSGMSQVMDMLRSTKAYISSELLINLLFITFCAAFPIYAAASLPDGRKESVKQFVKDYAFLGLVVLLIVLPQLLLYAKSGIYERYKFPLVMGLALLLAELVHIIYNSPKRFFLVKVVLSLLFLLMFYRVSVNTFANALSYAESAKSTALLFSNIEGRTEDRILIVADPVLQYESSISTFRFLKYSKDCPNVFIAPISIGRNELLFSSKDENYQNSLADIHKETIGMFYAKEGDQVGYKFVIYELDEMEGLFLRDQPWYPNEHDSLNYQGVKLLIYR